MPQKRMECFRLLFDHLACVKRYPLTPPHYLSLLTISLLTPAGDQLVAEGATHISLPTQEYDRGRQEKTNRRTNTNKAWGYQEQRKVCNTICMCRLSLAWVTSENSTILESDILRLFFTGPYLVSSPLCSGVWC